MAAEFKSHVLKRDEKGFLNIPFKRWLLSGVCGGFVFALGSIPLGSIAIPLAISATVVLLIITGKRRGMPLWQRWLFQGRGALILAAAQRPAGVVARVATLLELPIETVIADGDQIFAPPTAETPADYTEWVTLVDPHVETDGLIFIEQAIAEEGAIEEVPVS